MKRKYISYSICQGAFKQFKHEHHFKNTNGKTVMTDYFNYISPFELLGRIVDKLFLKKYMTILLDKRNQTIKEFAESENWKTVLDK